MMNKRVALQNLLTSFQTQAGETPHVYFDPPESVKMTYPCFVYHYIGNSDVKANDQVYLRSEEYTVRYITKKADPILPEAIMDLPYVTFENHYTSENLHHFMFTFRGQFGKSSPRLVLENTSF